MSSGPLNRFQLTAFCWYTHLALAIKIFTLGLTNKILIEILLLMISKLKANLLQANILYLFIYMYLYICKSECM